MDKIRDAMVYPNLSCLIRSILSKNDLQRNFIRVNPRPIGGSIFAFQIAELASDSLNRCLCNTVERKCYTFETKSRATRHNGARVFLAIHDLNYCQ
jgi:hypothetical protein